MHAIDCAALRRAAEHFVTITDAGYGEQLRREYQERVSELPPDQRYDRCDDPHRDALVHSDAELLALVVDAPLDQCLTALREVRGDDQRRDVGLALLSELAGGVRRVQALAARTRLSGRASS